MFYGTREHGFIQYEVDSPMHYGLITRPCWNCHDGFASMSRKNPKPDYNPYADPRDPDCEAEDEHCPEFGILTRGDVEYLYRVRGLQAPPAPAPPLTTATTT